MLQDPLPVSGMDGLHTEDDKIGADTHNNICVIVGHRVHILGLEQHSRVLGQGTLASAFKQGGVGPLGFTGIGHFVLVVQDHAASAF